MHQHICEDPSCGGVHNSGQRFYVSVVDGNRYRLLLGPYATHAEAINNVERGKTLSMNVDPRAFWYFFGTCSISGFSRRSVFGK